MTGRRGWLRGVCGDFVLVWLSVSSKRSDNIFCFVDGPRSRLLRPWLRAATLPSGHVALSLNWTDLVPNGEAERQTSQSRQAGSLANFELELVEL